MRLVNVLYGFGVLFSIAGIGFLAAEYIVFLSEAGKLASLLLIVAMFSFLTKYFDRIGW